MPTTKQKEAAKRNPKTRAAQMPEPGPESTRAPGVNTAQEKRLPTAAFAFPKQRKEPLTDAMHVRNTIARFDQVEDVSDADRDPAWKKTLAAAKEYDIDVDANDWRELFKAGKAKKK
jgi:hypothetical protein